MKSKGLLEEYEWGQSKIAQDRKDISDRWEKKGCLNESETIQTHEKQLEIDSKTN